MFYIIWIKKLVKIWWIDYIIVVIEKKKRIKNYNYKLWKVIEKYVDLVEGWKKERKNWILMIYYFNLESLWGYCKKSNVIKY